jgi:hypothetical protein
MLRRYAFKEVSFVLWITTTAKFLK